MIKNIGLFAIVNLDSEKYFEEWLDGPLEYGEQPCWVESRLQAWNTISLESALAYKRQLLHLGYEVDVLAYDGAKVG